MENEQGIQEEQGTQKGIIPPTQEGTPEPLSRAEVIDMLRREAAGYYCFFADEQRDHPEQLCVKAEGQWYLIPRSVAVLKPSPPNGEDEEVCYEIEFADPNHPVAAMIGREREKFGPGSIKSEEAAREFVAKMIEFSSCLPSNAKTDDSGG